MAATLALMAAFLFAVAATLQQKGALNLDGVSLGKPESLVQLVGQRMWLFGTAALLVGYALQAAALDRGRLAIIQPLLVTTIVFALPLGWWLTNQHVGRREVVGAAVIVIGLAAFVIYGDPAGGKDNAPNDEWAIAITVLCAICAVLLLLGRHGTPTTTAAVYGTVAGILFGLSAALTKPTVELLHEGVGDMLSHWQCYALAIAGILGFILQQVSLGTGRLAPSVATVSVANPIVGVLLGVAIFDERFSRPAWHVVVAILSLLLALGGAVLISLSSKPGPEPESHTEPAEGSTALA
jgi:drug/metabolite transporter (DMT)-like permease